MTAIFEFPLGSETLGPEEIMGITGCARRGDQIQWLQTNKWEYCVNKAGEPIIGRMYARLRLAGISPVATFSGKSGWAPDFSAVK